MSHRFHETKSHFPLLALFNARKIMSSWCTRTAYRPTTCARISSPVLLRKSSQKPTYFSINFTTRIYRETPRKCQKFHKLGLRSAVTRQRSETPHLASHTHTRCWLRAPEGKFVYRSWLLRRTRRLRLAIFCIAD